MTLEEIQKHLSFQLPDWFSLKNYQDVYNYNAELWGRCLSDRMKVKGIIQRKENFPEGCFLPAAVESMKLAHLCPEAQHEMVMKKTKAGDLSHARESITRIVGRKISSRKSRVRLTNMRDIFSYYDYAINSCEYIKLKDSLPEDSDFDSDYRAILEETPERSALKVITKASIVQIYNYSNDKQMDLPPHETPIIDMTHPKGYKSNINTSTELINIDLGCTDKDLIDDFKEVLSVIRKKRESAVKKNQYNESDFKKWAENKVLLYIDLSLLASINNSKIKDHQALTILFGDDEGSVDQSRVTKTLKNYVKKLLNYETINALHRQVEKEKK